MRAPGDEDRLVRSAAAGDPAAAAALWDAHGPGAYAFCRRILGDGDAAADAAQDAFLLALSEPGEDFGQALLRAARQTSFELLAAGRGAGRPPGTGLAAAAGRLRPQQRAALALSALEGLPYAGIAAVLGIGAEAVPALLARARLRLHDELHGTALAAAAVRSPDCEDVVPLLAAAADGELDAADAAWADPHVLRCPTCPRTRRAMLEAAATYAAWSPAAPPSWLRAATLAEVGAEVPGASVPVAAGSPPLRRAGRRAAGARVTPRPSLSTALLGSTLLTAAFAALLLAGAGALRQQDPVRGGARLPDGARSVQVARLPAARGRRPAARRTARRAHRAHREQHAGRVSFVPVAAVRRVPARAPSLPPRHRAPSRPHRPAARPKRTRAPRPAPVAPAPPTPSAPVPVSANAPADESPSTSATTAAAPATTATAAPATTAAVAAPATPSVASPAPKPAAPASAPAVPAGHDWHDHGDRDARSRRGSCPPRGRHDR